MSDELFWAAARRVCTEKQFRVLELRDRHGFSLSQTAEACGVGVPTVRGLQRAAYHALQKHFNDEEEAAIGCDT